MAATPATTDPALEGVVGALLTPFDGSGAVDLDTWAAEIDFLAGHADAISVLGPEVSEYRVLTPQARRDALAAGIELVAGRRPVLAGASSGSVAEVAELAQLAHDRGAALAQVLLPKRAWGGEPTAAELTAFVKAVVAASPLPVVLYHNPGHGADPSLDALIELCAIDGVVGLKDSSRNVSRILRAIEAIERAGHARYLGTIQPLLVTLQMGGAGAMVPAPTTLVAAALLAAFHAGDLDRAVELQRQVAIFPARWSAAGLAPVMKAAMAAIGTPVGPPAPPAAPLAGEDARAIERIVAGWTTLAPEAITR